MAVFILFLLGGLVVTVLSVAGIIALAKRLNVKDEGGKILMVIGILLLAGLALAGVATAGCAAILLTSK